jgi:hypothetical protein
MYLCFNWVGRKINSFDGTDESYIFIHMYIKEIMEHTQTNPINLDVSPRHISLPTHKTWQAFYTAFVEYLVNNIYKNKISKPKWLVKNKWKLAKPTVLIQWDKCHTPQHKSFLEYNVLIPEGELLWV